MKIYLALLVFGAVCFIIGIQVGEQNERQKHE